MNKAVSVYFLSALAAGGLTLNATGASAELATKSSVDTTGQVLQEGVGASVSSSLQGLLSNMKQYRAGFDQTVVDAQQNVVHEAQGTLTMTRPNKLRWETTFPDETLLVADGNAVWNVDTFVEQVTVLSQDNAIKDNPIVLLTSTDEAIWSKFSISQVNSGVSTNNLASGINNDNALQSYQITPKEEGGQILTLTLTFNQDNELASLNMLDAQQQISTLVFNNIETRFPVPADTFSVDIPDSFIVDDQR
jgi:outer membrane lipoprotein carrier protein